MKRRTGTGFYGFTLLELVIAAGLAAIMASAVVVLLGRGLAAWQRAEGGLAQLFQLERGLHKMEQELRNGVVLADRPFQADKSQITFACAQDSTHLSQITYKFILPPGAISFSRISQPYPPSNKESPQTSTVFSGIASLSFQYAAVKEEQGRRVLQWVDSWDSSEQNKELPEWIRIRIQMDDPKSGKRSVTSEIWIPHGALATLTRG